jgi:hypothetical protein
MHWYLAMHLMTSTKKGFFANELRRQIGHKRYEPIWCLMRKIRESMGMVDSKKPLRNSVTIDDIYISTYISSHDRLELKRGKGSQKKSKVTLMTESIPLVVNGKHELYLGRVKMEVTESEASQELDEVAKNNIEKDSVIFSNISTGYINLK